MLEFHLTANWSITCRLFKEAELAKGLNIAILNGTNFYFSNIYAFCWLKNSWMFDFFSEKPSLYVINISQWKFPMMCWITEDSEELESVQYISLLDGDHDLVQQLSDVQDNRLIVVASYGDVASKFVDYWWCHFSLFFPPFVNFICVFVVFLISTILKHLSLDLGSRWYCILKIWKL